MRHPLLPLAAALSAAAVLSTVPSTSYPTLGLSPQTATVAASVPRTAPRLAWSPWTSPLPLTVPVAPAVAVVASVSTTYAASAVSPTVPRPRPRYRAAGAAPPRAGSSVSAYEACVLRRESGGNPRAYNPTSGASGAYQFMSTTWRTVTGLPGSAGDYPMAVQRAAFLKLYATAGRSPWASDRCG